MQDSNEEKIFLKNSERINQEKVREFFEENETIESAGETERLLEKEEINREKEKKEFSEPPKREGSLSAQVGNVNNFAGEEERVDELLKLIEKNGIEPVLEAVKKADNPRLLDLFHDKAVPLFKEKRS